MQDAPFEHLKEPRQLAINLVREGPLVNVGKEDARAHAGPGDEMAQVMHWHLLAAPFPHPVPVRIVRHHAAGPVGEETALPETDPACEAQRLGPAVGLFQRRHEDLPEALVADDGSSVGAILAER